ncbi:ABC-three component system middle component 6 [Endozoicomonas sp. 2B-B]
MLLPNDIHPENSIYYNGAVVLKTLQESGKMDLLELYEKAKNFSEMSFPLFILCLDWLYLIDAAVLNYGEVELCS